jgi:hypothetical protein
MKRRLSCVGILLGVAVGCGGSSSTNPSPNVSPSILPSPDLSAPQRFRPFVDQLALSPLTIKVGEVATVTGRVRTGSGMPSPEVSWILVTEPASVGNGVLSQISGSGDVRSEFRANYKGEVMLVAYAVDSRGVPSLPARTALTVLP